LSADQIGHQCRHAIVLALQPVVLDRHVLAFDIAAFTKALAERGRITRVGMERLSANNADHRHCRLLRARCERPRDGRAAETQDELAPSHVPSKDHAFCNA
jgi:hypothetical protein